jgi:hypothetical protein
MSTLTKLEELKRDINNAIITARHLASTFAEQAKLAREMELKAAAEKREMDEFNVIAPYLKKLPELMREAGRKGSTIVRFELPTDDFKDYNGHRTSTPKTNSTTATLMRYFTNAGLPVQTRIITTQEEDSGAYDERIIWNVYELEVKF